MFMFNVVHISDKRKFFFKNIHSYDIINLVINGNL